MNTRELALDWSGTILDGRYRILGQLGRGGMGHVYAAVHMALDQQVAIKVLHPRLAEDERFRARFLQEARAASRIRHPNVVEIRDFGTARNGSVYFVMEYLSGHDLGEELRRRGPLRWARARNILVQAASALQAAHAKKIIHRDIKPANCFLFDDEDAGLVDVVKLVDFGIAKVGDALGKRLTVSGEILGTIRYMSPEQARCEPLDPRSDVYSLGAMAYEILTGLPPFRGTDALRVITAHLEEEPEPVRRLAPEVPTAVEAVVLTMLAKSAKDRYASMKDVVQALRAIPETAGKRSTQLWTPMGDLRSSSSRVVRVEAAAPKETVAPGPSAADVETLADGGLTVPFEPAPPREPRANGAWSAVVLTGAHTLAGAASSVGSSTELRRAASDTVAPEPRGWARLRPSRRLAEAALLGLLGLLAVGGGTMLVAKAWSSGPCEPPGGEASEQRPALGDRDASRWPAPTGPRAGR